MTKPALWLGLVLAVAAGCGDSPSGDADRASLPETVYGKGVECTLSVKVSELSDNIDRYVGKRVRIEGLVTDVCPKRGCWIELASDREYESLLFKVQDGVIVFPMSMKGKYAVADGVARKVELDLEQTRRYLAHKAEEKGETFDPATVKEPITYVRLDGVGALVRDRK
ncbi:MAG: DUF4920 domain-containing protein [Planctomycetota bacterium]|jgi:hypothetical protein